MYALIVLLLLCIILIYVVKYECVEQYTDINNQDTSYHVEVPSLDENYIPSKDENYIPSKDDTINTIETFTSSNDNSPALQFISPLNIISNELMLDGNQNTFWQETKFDNDANIFHDTIILNGNSTLHIGDQTITKDDIIPIKKAVSKLQYISEKTKEDMTSFKDGMKSQYSSETTGTNECSATVWKILMNEQVTQEDMCNACCTQTS